MYHTTTQYQSTSQNGSVYLYIVDLEAEFFSAEDEVRCGERSVHAHHRPAMALDNPKKKCDSMGRCGKKQTFASSATNIPN